MYAVGHAALRPEGRWLAGVLACGEGAVLSHRSAARLWGLSSVAADPAVHVTVRRGDPRPSGIVVHRVATSGADVTVHRGVPTTTVARTYVDLADELSYPELRRAADRGVRLNVAAVRRAQARAPNRRGRGRLARLIGDDGAELRSRSGLERHALRLRAQPGSRGRASTTGSSAASATSCGPGSASSSRSTAARTTHPAPHASDHARDAELVLAGWRVLRFTDTQLDHDEDAVVAALGAARTPAAVAGAAWRGVPSDPSPRS